MKSFREIYFSVFHSGIREDYFVLDVLKPYEMVSATETSKDKYIVFAGSAEMLHDQSRSS